MRTKRHDWLAPVTFSIASVMQWGDRARGIVSLVLSLAFPAAILGCAYVAKSLPLAVYALSFWHYYLYWLAYYFGAVSISVFKRDAIMMKTISLFTLGAVYFSAATSFVSLAVMAAGFLLNGLAARVLGSDRTYYGYELADHSPLRIARFPYSWISHPMLVGNMAAFGGTLINADFRRQWWPLACAHVALNLGLLIMELAVTPQRRNVRSVATSEAEAMTSRRSLYLGLSIVASGTLAGAIGFGHADSTKLLGGMGAGACTGGYAYALYCYYSVAPSQANHRSDTVMENSV